MSMYAVVDPATGETVKEYPTITYDELRDAIARADRAHREWSKASTVAERAALVRRVGELHLEPAVHGHVARHEPRRPRADAPAQRGDGGGGFRVPGL